MEMGLSNQDFNYKTKRGVRIRNAQTNQKHNEQNANNHLGNRNALRFLPNQKPIYNYLHGVYRWLHFKKNSNQKSKII